MQRPILKTASRATASRVTLVCAISILMSTQLPAACCTTNTNNITAQSCAQTGTCTAGACTACTTACIAPITCSCHSVYIPRSAHSNTALFWLPHTASMCDWNGQFELSLEYQQSFRNKDIATSLFGDNVLLFQGSQVALRDNSALIADQFGLSPVFDGTLKLCPSIKNINLHGNAHVGFDAWVSGLYAELQFTFSRQQRTLSACELILSDTLLRQDFGGQASFPVGYMAGGSQPVAAATSIKQALAGNFTFGDMQTPWEFSKFKFCSQTKHGVAGVTLIAGYDFWRDSCDHLGIFLRYTAPTGNKPNPHYVFSPVVGDGKHHEIGAGITHHAQLWSKDDNQAVSFYLDGYVVGLLQNTQLRTFDFKRRGCLSRYMLLKELTAPTAELTTLASSLGAKSAGFSYAGNLINAVNFTTRAAQVKVAAKGDASLRCIYSNGGVDFCVGYNIYGQTQEKICLANNNCNPTTNKNYGIKGCTGTNTYLYSTNSITVGTLTTPNDFPLNSTSSGKDSTITSCGAVDSGVEILVPGTTIGVDWTQAYAPNASAQANAVPTGTPVGNITTSELSNPAKALTSKALNLCSGAAPSQLAHKGFMTLTYTWDCDYTPLLAFGFEAEGSGNCGSLKQWGVWLTGGCAF